jgi:hypothetical protein
MLDLDSDDWDLVFGSSVSNDVFPPVAGFVFDELTVGWSSWD